ncbi:hypothetical protein ONZ43_g82 [Nemania bipapillata]|uniref:Uncharacterized protein n=1 Tax=Nemania bipapillata TaxID=110536 RepID=A0ACC2J9N6_9PEZI|nr:hypothetical protein ONZ43_g82 [Nemania bipapillata]
MTPPSGAQSLRSDGGKKVEAMARKYGRRESITLTRLASFENFFAPETKEEFEGELSDPAELKPPTPGWKLTPLSEDVLTPVAEPTPVANTATFPIISPLSGTKLSAVRSEDGKVHVYYQSSDSSIHELLFEPGKAWKVIQTFGPNQAKLGSPLTAISGGWSEVRLFYVKIKDTLAGMYCDDHTQWMSVDIPEYELSPTAMLTAVAWNYASPLFEIRIYTTDDRDGLYGFSFSRGSNRWTPAPHCLNNVPVKSLSPEKGSGIPLSAVTAVITDAEWRTKVYFHPRRHVAEWDVCDTSVSYSGAPMAGDGAAARRQIEEETRVRIKEDEARKELERQRREEAERQRVEEERRRREEEEKRRREEEEKQRRELEEKQRREEEEKQRREQEEKKRREEEEKRRREEEAKKALPNAVRLRNPIPIMGALSGASDQIDDVFKPLDLPFAVNLYGHASKRIYVSDNGILSLDADTNARRNTVQWKPLPFRDNIPPYSMFPFWADLMISKGKAHGIYYEIAGDAPNRSLTVEWYVTRYGQESQYFHFDLSIQEWRLGVVTFRYYDVNDEGSQCTVGVQGPNAHLMFSHNERKVRPGLRVEFDTSKNTMTASQFQL